MNAERSRAKTEFTALKKIADDAEEMLKTTTQELKKKETTWKADKSNLEREIASLKKQVQACRNGEGSEHEDKASVHDSDTDDPPSSLARHESDKITVIDLKKELALYEKKANSYP
ncbi:unnamed protein product [Strongylus vulgaris]|uniref:Uncharacterized protein n=1 Tax=Strongylus vulgaris TaxID=40348 RepID=A0A3P7LGE5_STRVU|nr:unnamed protein product [Strongylus vulgaris]